MAIHKPGRGKHPRKKKKQKLTIHTAERVPPATIPEGAVFKGFRSFDVQDIVFHTHNTRYELERWKLPNGTYIQGALPAGIHGHYGVALRAYVLQQTYQCRVPEGLLLQQLLDMGVLISAGQLHELVTADHGGFHKEKAEVLTAAIATGEIQTDDVGARHMGQNCYTNVICNDFCVILTTTDSKSRINFLEILAQGQDEYLLNGDAYRYLEERGAKAHLVGSLRVSGTLAFASLADWEAFLKGYGYLSSADRRHLTEAALVASLIAHGVPRDLGIHSDDAGQFDLFVQSLCWVHEERHYRKLLSSCPEMAHELDLIKDAMWELYRGLRAYKLNPTDSERARLSQAFDDLFNPRTPSAFSILAERLALTCAKKTQLLRVLERPAVPIHNNQSETAGRCAKIKGKISGGTHCEKGRRAWDTFLSLLLTCRKHLIGFAEYLKDRILGLGQIGRLGEIISRRAQGLPLPT
ncbi:MAG: IS66 family transposase [Chlamydiia bacterium]